jgi:hypothetical protein
MRALALAAVFGVGLTVAGITSAAAWTDPNGNINIDAPRGWTVRPQQISGGTAVLVFTPSSDCYFFGIPNPATANASPTAAHHSTTPIAPESWIAALNPIGDFVSGGAPTLTSQSVDTSGFWPVQRAQLASGSRVIYGMVQARPGVELRGFCSGPDASYDSILNSVSHPNDQTWQAAAEAAAVAAAAAPPAAETPPAAAEEEGGHHRPRHERGITRGPASGSAPM